MKRRTGLVAASVVVVSLFGMCCISLERMHERRPNENIEMMGNVANLLIKYHEKYSRFPSGSEGEIARVLVSEFPENVPPSMREVGTDEEGRFIDKLGNLIHFKTSEKNGVYLYSAGPNKKLGDKDDIQHYRQLHRVADITTEELEKRWKEELASKQN